MRRSRLDRADIGAGRSGWITCLAALVALLAVTAPTVTEADAQTGAPPASGIEVPTTKLLAIGSFTSKGTPERRLPLLPAEVRDTVRLYLAGKIDQWYLKQDRSGVVFMMNVTDPGEAQALLGRFPFGQAGLMEFQLIPLGPIGPLRVLLGEPAQ